VSAISLTADVLRSFHDGSVPPAVGTATIATATTATAPPEPIGASTPLRGVAGEPDGDLLDTLRRRRAIRFFAADPVPAGPLRAAVEAGLAADARRWPGEQGCCPLHPVVVAQHVTGLTPAAYRFDGDQAVPVMPLGPPETYADLTLQHEFAAAGAIVTFVGDLAHAEAVHGGPGYRLLMIRAGAAAYRTWLAAIGHGLAGSVFAGFLPAAVRAPLRCDGVRRHQLFALALGFPASEDARPDRVGADPKDEEGR
jgi:nitroreductase